jgi:hypothetical protein
MIDVAPYTRDADRKGGGPRYSSARRGSLKRCRLSRRSRSTDALLSPELNFVRGGKIAAPTSPAPLSEKPTPQPSGVGIMLKAGLFKVVSRKARQRETGEAQSRGWRKEIQGTSDIYPRWVRTSSPL